MEETTLDNFLNEFCEENHKYDEAKDLAYDYLIEEYPNAEVIWNECKPTFYQDGSFWGLKIVWICKGDFNYTVRCDSDGRYRINKKTKNN